MAIKITQGEAVLFDSVTGYAFGPVWGDYEEAEDFLKWTETETAAELSDMEPRAVAALVSDFRKEREEAPLRGDPGALVDVAEWIRHGEELRRIRERRSADGLRRQVAELNAEFAALQGTGRRTLADYAEAGLAAVSRKMARADLRADFAVDNAVGFYVRDNGDCVPEEAAEGIRAEVWRIIRAEN